MAAALLAAMRPKESDFDPALALKKVTAAAPNYSMRQKTLYGDWQSHYFDTFGATHMVGDLQEETNVVRDRAPRYTMRPRTVSPMSVARPGPGEYSIPSTVAGESPVSRAAPVWQFGSTERDKTHNGVAAFTPKTPSPTTYDVSRDGAIGRADQEAVPSYTMRPQTQDPAEAAYRQKRSPRPSVHEYSVTHDHVDLAKERSPKYTMRPKASSPLRSTTPAPGTYDNPSIVGNAHPSASKAPLWGFGSTNRENVAGRILAFMPCDTPAPTKYDVTRDGAIGRANQEKVPSYSMRSRSPDRRSDAEYKEQLSPRPGVHEYKVTHDHVDLTKSCAPKFSMRPRSSQRSTSRQKSPGPGSYDVPCAIGRKRSPIPRSASAWGFGSSKRFQDKKPDNRIYSY
jgi:hypothetical protein